MTPSESVVSGYPSQATYCLTVAKRKGKPSTIINYKHCFSLSGKWPWYRAEIYNHKAIIKLATGDHEQCD